MSEAVSEQELKAKAVAPRVTLEDVNGSIVSEHFFTAYQGAEAAQKANGITDPTPPEALRLLTFCVLVLKNGYTVHGTSACADPANYNREIGERLAKANAVNQIWPLLGYQLRDRLFTEGKI